VSPLRRGHARIGALERSAHPSVRAGDVLRRSIHRALRVSFGAMGIVIGEDDAAPSAELWERAAVAHQERLRRSTPSHAAPFDHEARR
jgi:hypothetical protein